MTFKTWINDLRDVQSVINNISNTRVIIDGATGLLNTNSLKEMSSAVSGLSKEQALLVLSTKNLNAAQQEQVLLAAGIISSENSITASAISQALAKTQLSATEKEALLTKLGLIDATTGEAIANATCTKEELLKVLATKGIIGADADAIISSIGLTSANSAQAISFDLLTASIWANIKALGKWLITNPVGWAILGGTAIFGLVKAYDALTDSVEEVQERTDKLLDSYSSAISEANSNAKTIESLADRYGELSKGVNNLGENVSLTSDEYSEYKSIVDQIAEMFPTLITGYTDEGTAILSLKGNVEKLRDAYKEAQTEAYNLLIVSGEDSDGNDIISNYKNQVNGNESWLSKQSSYIDGDGGAKDAIDIITKLTGALTPDEFRNTYNELYKQYKNIWNSDKIQDALKSSGFEELSHAPKWRELTSDDLAKVKSTAQATIQTYRAEIDSQLKNVDTLANAYLMTNKDYSKLDEQSQTAASLIVNNITEDIANGFKSKEDVGAYVANIVSQIKNNPDLNNALIGLFTDNLSQLSPDEAEQKVDKYLETISSILHEDKNELKIRLGFEDVYDLQKNYQNTINRFKSDTSDSSSKKLDSLNKQLDEQTQNLVEAKENLQNEYGKISDWGLDDYADQIKNDTIQTKFGNVDMDKRQIIDWNIENIEKWKDALQDIQYYDDDGNFIDSYYDQLKESVENGYSSIDTVFGDMMDHIEGYGDITALAFSHIVNNDDGTFEFLGQKTAEEYLYGILDVAKQDGDMSIDHILELDKNGIQNAQVYNSQGEQIGETYIHGIISGFNDKAEDISKLTHFAGKFGAVQIAQSDIDTYNKQIEETKKKIKEVSKGFDDSQKIKDFFDTEGINTDEEINDFNKVTEGINDADEAIQKWNEHKKEANETPISFANAWQSLQSATDDTLKGQADDLLELAQAGRLTTEALEGLAGGQELMSKTGMSAEKVAAQINSLTDASTQLNSLSTQISKMSDMLADKKNGTVASASDLAGFDVSVRGLESWDKFEEVMGSTESSMKQCQKAANDLATEWVNDGNFLSNLTEENKQYYITQLDQMGVLNSSAVIEQALAAKRAEESAQTEYNTIATKYNTQAKTENEKVTTDLTNATPKEIAEILSEASASKTAQKSIAELYLSKLDINSTKINTQDDVNNIIAIAKAAGTSKQYIDQLQSALNKLVNGNTFNNGTKFYDLANGVTSGKVDYSSGFPSMDELKKQGIKQQAKNTAQNIVNEIKDGITEIKVPDIEIKPTGSSSYKDPNSKKSKSKSKTKSDAKEVFDFIAIYLDKITDKASKAKDKIEDLLTFGQKKKQTKKAIEATTKAIAAQEKAYKRYMDYANKQAKKQNAKKTTSTSSSSSSSSSSGNAVYDEATNYLGLKYVWGGASLTSGADCSGFTQQIYKKYGVSLPHHAAYQAQMGTKITSKKDLQAGDLVFFGTKNNIKHVGIYGGDGKFIESPHTGASVRVSSLSSRDDFVSGSRFSKVNDSTVTTSTSGKNVKKVKGVSSKTLEHYKKLIRNGTLDSDGIQAISNENLKNALQDYQTWYEKAKACKDQIESLKDQLKDLYETLANNPIDKSDKQIEKLGTKMDLLNSKVENAVVNADKKSTITSVNKLYKDMASNYDSQLNASEKAYTTAKSNFSSSKKTLTNKFNKYSAKKLGLTSAELKTIKNNLKNNKKIPGSLINKLNKSGYFDLYEKCIAHNEYLDAYNTSIDNVRQAREDNKSNKRQTASDQFDKISGAFDNKLSSIEHITNTAQANLDYAEATGHYATQGYYRNLLNSNQKTMAEEQAKMDQLIKQRDAFVKSGDIKKGSDEWYQMSKEIWQCAENIQSCKQNTAEYNNALRDLEWDAFDRQEEYLGRIADEANFLIDLMDSKNKFDKNGNITSYGKSIEGLHAVNANVYQAQADDYEKRIRELDEEYKNDQYNKDYLEKRQSWLESQREAIKNCESEKQVIASLAKEGYESMSNALDKLIDRYKSAYTAQKSLYDYQKSIASKTKNIASLRKQLKAISGDMSEENKANIQKLQVKLDEANQDLQDTEYEKFLSDFDDLTSKISDDFKNWIDSRMKQTDDIVNDVIKQTNASGNEIKDTLTSVTRQYGTALTDKMGEIWDSSNGLNNIVSNMWTGDDGIKNSFTTVNTTLNDIRTYCKTLSEGSLNSFNQPSSYDVLKYVEDAFENKTPRSTTSTSNSSGGNKNTTTTTKNANTLTGIPASSSSKTSSSSSKKDSSSSSNASWASKYLIHKKYTGNKSKLNKSSLVDRLKYFDFDSSMDARKEYYKKLFKGAYSGTAAQNNKLIAEMKKHGFKKGGEIGDLVKLTGEDGFVLARKGEGILTPENMETLRESIKISNATLSMINNLTKTPQIKPSNLNNTVNPTVNIGDIQVVANNPQEFAREFRNTVINDPKTQKMLSTFIGNQLTGGNSLEFKKYK